MISAPTEPARRLLPCWRTADSLALGLIALCWAALVAYRAVYLEPRVWGSLCAGAAPPLACVPRAGLLWLQRWDVLGRGALALGVWSFVWPAPRAACVAAIVLGIAAVENYAATWGMVGVALGAWAWMGLAGTPERRGVRP